MIPLYDRISQLEAQVTALHAEVAELRATKPSTAEPTEDSIIRALLKLGISKDSFPQIQPVELPGTMAVVPSKFMPFSQLVWH